MQMSYFSLSDWHVWLCSVGWQTPNSCHQRPRRVWWLILILVVLWSGALTIELPFYSPRLAIHPSPRLLLFIREEGRSQRAVGEQRSAPGRSPVRHRLISTQRQFTVLLAVGLRVLRARRHSEGEPHEQRGNMELCTERFNVTGIYFLAAVVGACAWRNTHATFMWNRLLTVMFYKALQHLSSHCFLSLVPQLYCFG